MTSPDAARPPATPVPGGLLIASTLSWVMGIIVLAMALAIGIPAAAVGRGGLFALVTAVVGLALCYAGFGLRKARPSAGWAAICAAGGFVTLQLIGTGGRLTPAMGLYLVIILLVLANWKHLRTG